ncbi:MAG: hypothetical protein ACFFG0_03640 [Candidatus Thorarchaeota archaeon]
MKHVNLLNKETGEIIPAMKDEEKGNYTLGYSYILKSGFEDSKFKEVDYIKKVKFKDKSFYNNYDNEVIFYVVWEKNNKYYAYVLDTTREYVELRKKDCRVISNLEEEAIKEMYKEEPFINYEELKLKIVTEEEDEKESIKDAIRFMEKLKLETDKICKKLDLRIESIKIPNMEKKKIERLDICGLSECCLSPEQMNIFELILDKLNEIIDHINEEE